MDAQLVVVGGKTSKRVVPLILPAVIGRSREADVTVAHPMISRRHCEIFEQNGQLMLRDLASLNGTMIHGERVEEAVLPPDAEFTIGPLTFRVLYQYAGEAGVQPTMQFDPGGHHPPPLPPQPMAYSPMPQQAIPQQSMPYAAPPPQPLPYAAPPPMRGAGYPMPTAPMAQAGDMPVAYQPPPAAYPSAGYPPSPAPAGAWSAPVESAPPVAAPASVEPPEAPPHDLPAERPDTPPASRAPSDAEEFGADFGAFLEGLQ